MSNFLFLYTGGGMPESDAEQAQVQKAWETWLGGLGADVVDAGNPTAPAAKSIMSDGSVGDGPDGKLVTGYSIIQAESLDSAVSKAKGCPILVDGGNISVYEIFPAM